MIIEQKLKNIDNGVVLQKIKSNGKYIDKNDNIEIEFYGDKDILDKKDTNEIKHNNYLVGKYKKIYIGCLSLNKPFSREKFGLNKYFKDIFYLGQWKENLKDGIGFLKVKNEILYLGEFSKNQFNGFGILNYKLNDISFMGNFIDGMMDSGIYYNNKTTVFYNGKFKNGKKNDKLCSYYDYNNKHIFIGEVKDDIFIRGYLSICNVTEENNEKESETNISIEKVIYFDKTDPNKTKYELFYNFDMDFYDKIQNIFFNVFQEYFDLKNMHKNYYLAFLEYLENIVYNDSYNEYLERYNPDEENNLENNFIKNYESYHKSFTELENKLNLNEYENIINSEPIIQTEYKISLK